MSAEPGPPGFNPMKLILVLEIPIWGMITSLGLFGVIVNQAWTYATRNKDGWLLRSLVAAVIALDFAAVVICFKVVRFELFENYGNPRAIPLIPTYFAGHTLIVGLAVFIVQCYFATAVLVLNQRKFLVPGIIVVTGLGALIGSILVTVNDIQRPNLSELSTQRKIELGAFNVLSVISDLTSTLALTSHLWQSNGIKSTQAIVAKILRNVVTRGLVVTVAQIVNLILSLSMQDSFGPLALFYCLDKIYVITFLAMLNGRAEIKAKLESSVHVSMSTLRGTNPRSQTTFIDDKFDQSHNPNLGPMKFRETQSHSEV